MDREEEQCHAKGNKKMSNMPQDERPRRSADDGAAPLMSDGAGVVELRLHWRSLLWPHPSS